MDRRWRSISIATLFYWALWLVLVQSFDPQEMIAGAVVAFFVAFLSKGEPFTTPIHCLLAPKRILYSIIYVFYLFFAIVRSNLDVARRVVSPSLPINPGIVKIKTRLKSPLGKMILANSITLTPGTLTVDVRGDDFYIHWIDVETKDVQAATEKIAAGFEKYLEVICG